MTTTTLNVTPITENFQTCKPAVLDIPMYNVHSTYQEWHSSVGGIHWDEQGDDGAKIQK